MREVTAEEYAKEQGCAKSTARKRLAERGAQVRERIKKVRVYASGGYRTINSRYFTYMIEEDGE